MRIMDFTVLEVALNILYFKLPGSYPLLVLSGRRTSKRMKRKRMNRCLEEVEGPLAEMRKVMSGLATEGCFRYLYKCNLVKNAA